MGSDVSRTNVQKRKTKAARTRAASTNAKKAVKGRPERGSAVGRIVLQDRATAFAAVQSALGLSLRARSKEALLAEGDALHLLSAIPDESISLILTDPPYHATKKRNIVNDTAFASDCPPSAPLRQVG